MPDSKRKPIIDSIREYVRTYPDIDNRKINIDYLGDGMEYSIDPIGVDPIYKRYVDGSCLKQFQFAAIKLVLTEARLERQIPKLVGRFRFIKFT